MPLVKEGGPLARTQELRRKVQRGGGGRGVGWSLDLALSWSDPMGAVDLTESPSLCRSGHL